MRLAHLSDVHLLPASGLIPLLPSSLTSAKRMLGFLNMAFRRGPNKYDRRLLVRALHDAVHVRGADAVAVSGDLTNLALESEFEAARGAFEEVLGPDWEKKVITVPGNHDIYCPASRAERFYFSHFGATMTSDIPQPPTSDRDGGFPFVRLLPDGVALIGVNSAFPRPLFHASGEVGPEQMRRLEDLLDHPRVRQSTSVVVMLHHPASKRFDSKWERKSGLLNRSAFARLMEAKNVRLVIHGHTHRPFLASLRGDTLVSEAGSTTYSRTKSAGGYSIYEFNEGALRRILSIRADDQGSMHESTLADFPPPAADPSPAWLNVPAS